MNRRQFIRPSVAGATVATFSGCRSPQPEPSTTKRSGRCFFTSQGRTAIIHADGTGLRHFDFHVPDQVTWQPGPFLSDGRRVVFLSMETRRDGAGRRPKWVASRTRSVMPQPICPPSLDRRRKRLGTPFGRQSLGGRPTSPLRFAGHLGVPVRFSPIGYPDFSQVHAKAPWDHEPETTLNSQLDHEPARTPSGTAIGIRSGIALGHRRFRFRARPDHGSRRSGLGASRSRTMIEGRTAGQAGPCAVTAPLLVAKTRAAPAPQRGWAARSAVGR